MIRNPVRPSRTAVSFVLLALLAVSFGCSSSDSAAIAELDAINASAEAETGSKAVRMQKQGDKVGTIYILSHIDEVMPRVGKLKNVEEVYFQDNGFEDKHVQYVNGLSSLNSLIVSKTKITNAGVEQLAGTKLQALFLDGTAITSEALKSVGKISSLISLDLTACDVADDLTPLASLKNLEWLVIRDMDLSKLDSASVTTLAELPKLSRLTVTNTGITDATIQTLKKAKPALNLEAEGGQDHTATAAGAGEEDAEVTD